MRRTCGGLPPRSERAWLVPWPSSTRSASPPPRSASAGAGSSSRRHCSGWWCSPSGSACSRSSYRAGGWRAAWVGFDTALLLVFAATAWAAWRRRQILIVCLMVLATLLVCDAWFDTTLDWGTKGFTLSLLSALLLELPLAVVALIGARRLLRLTIGRLEVLAGTAGPVPSFWRVPLFGDYPGSYRTLLRKSPDLASADVGDIPEITDVPQVTNVSEVTDVPEVRKAS